MNLVTGASGFIGSAVVRKLLARGQKVRCYVEPGAKLDNLKGLDVDIVTGDVNDRAAIERALDGCDTLYHLAAIYAIWLRDPSLMYRVNVEGGKTVLWAAYKAKLSKVVYDAMGIPETDQHFMMTDDTLPDERKFRAKDGKDYLLQFIGAGHHIGTHRMGVSPTDSVVNRDQRSWDHENLYIVGCGSFPTTGTANPTLTALAVTLRSTKDMLAQLR